jgi:hypothetical protein
MGRWSPDSLYRDLPDQLFDSTSLVLHADEPEAPSRWRDSQPTPTRYGWDDTQPLNRM